MGKEGDVHTHSGILLGHKNKEIMPFIHGGRNKGTNFPLQDEEALGRVWEGSPWRLNMWPCVQSLGGGHPGDMWPQVQGLEGVTLETVDMWLQVQGLGGVTLETVGMCPQVQGHVYRPLMYNIHDATTVNRCCRRCGKVKRGNLRSCHHKKINVL